MIRNIRLNTKTKQIIQSVYPTMSSLQQSIADYFLENTELLDFSSKRISKILYVSEPTLSRFAQKCNFKGYREFIYEYSNDLQNCEVDSSDKTSTLKKISRRSTSILLKISVLRLPIKILITCRRFLTSPERFTSMARVLQQQLQIHFNIA